MTRIRKLLALSALALAAPAVVAGCGDDDGGGEDPAALLREALSQDTQFDSGVIDVGLNGSLEGTMSGSLDASIGGPFQSGGEGQPPELQLDATANVSAEGIPNLPGGSISFDFDGGLALADDSLFVTYQDTAYEASKDLYSEISPLLESAQSAGDATQDPESADSFINSLTNLENEGTEDVEGESVSHVSGDLDFAKLAEESAATSGVPFDTSQLEGFTSSIDVFVSEEDKTFRKLDLSFAADQVAALSAAGVEGLDFTISVGISDVNSEQTIEAPTDTQPLDDLLQTFGASESQILEALQGGLVPGAGLTPDLGGGTGGGASTDPEVQQCVADAKDSDAIIECLNQ